MRKSMLTSAIALAVSACSTAAPQQVNTAAIATPEFRIERIGLPGEGRGDYINVDATTRRMYVTHSAAVHILDLDTLEPLAEVSGLTGAHGVSIDNTSGHGFVTDGVPANRVVMFDLSTGEVLKSVPSGEKPDSILFDPASGKIFAFNNESSDVTVIDPRTGEVIKTIGLPAGPEFSQTDGLGKIWVVLEEANAIAEIDSASLEVTRLMPLEGCEEPAPLGFDAGHRRLFAGCTGNQVMVVVDADSGAVLADVPIGSDPDGIIYDAANRRIFVANRKNGWTIIDQQDGDVYSVNQTLPMDEYAKTLAIDPVTNRVFSSSADLIWPEPTPGKKHLPNAASGTFRLIVVQQD